MTPKLRRRTLLALISAATLVGGPLALLELALRSATLPPAALEAIRTQVSAAIEERTGAAVTVGAVRVGARGLALHDLRAARNWEDGNSGAPGPPELQVHIQRAAFLFELRDLPWLDLLRGRLPSPDRLDGIELEGVSITLDARAPRRVPTSAEGSSSANTNELAAGERERLVEVVAALGPSAPWADAQATLQRFRDDAAALASVLEGHSLKELSLHSLELTVTGSSLGTVHLPDIDARATLTAGALDLDASFPAIDVPVVLGNVPAAGQAHASLNLEGLRVERLRVTTPSSELDVAGSLQDRGSTTALLVQGTARLGSDALPRALGALETQTDLIRLLRADSATASFQLSIPALVGEKWEGDATVAFGSNAADLTRAGARAGTADGTAGSTEALVDQVELHAAQRDAGGASLRTQARGQGLRGNFDIEQRGADLSASGAVHFDSVAALERTLQRAGATALPDGWLPNPGTGQGAAGLARLVGALRGPGGPVDIEGTFQQSDEATHAAASLRAADLQLSVWGPLGVLGAPNDHAQGELAQIKLSSIFSNVEFDQRGDAPWVATLKAFHLKGTALDASGSAELGPGGHEVTLSLRAADARLLGGLLPGAVLGGQWSGELKLGGDPSRPWRRVQGSLQAREVRWSAKPGEEGAPSFSLDRASASFDKQDQSEPWYVTGLALAASTGTGAGGAEERLGAELTGQAAFTNKSYEADLRLTKVDARWLAQLGYPIVKRGTLNAAVSLAGDRVDWWRRARASLELSGASLAPAEGLSAPQLAAAREVLGPLADAPLRLDHLTTRLQRDDTRWSVVDLRAVTSLGQLQASGSGDGVSHQLHGKLRGPGRELMSALLPGDVDQGSLMVSADAEGTSTHWLERASGKVQLDDLRWQLPRDTGLCASTWLIEHARADYSFQGGELDVRAIQVQSPLATAEGAIELRSGTTQVRANLASANVGALLDVVPELAGVSAGGRGTATLQLTADTRGLVGSIDGRVAGAALTVRDVSSQEWSRHPIDSARFRYRFGAGMSSLEGFELLGPEFNLNLDAKWGAGGALHGGGRVWFTPEYTDAVTGGGRWALQLLGYPRIDTRFSLSGSIDEVRLLADITHDARWQVLRVAVPDRVEAIASSRAPLIRRDDLATRAAACRR